MALTVSMTLKLRSVLIGAACVVAGLSGEARPLGAQVRHCDFKASATVTLNCVTTGNGPRRVVMLHGFGASYRTWDELLPLLDVTGITTYMLDLKGFGDSSKPRDEAYSLHDQADLITEFLRTLPPGPVTLVGHSYGGGVALLTYLQSKRAGSEVIDSLVFIDAAVYQQKLPFFIKAYQSPVLNFAVHLLGPERRVRFLLKRIVFDRTQVTDTMVRRYADPLKLEGSRYALTQVARQVVPDDAAAIEKDIRTIAVPSLIVWGANDPVISAHFGYRLAADINQAELHVLDHCGHAPPEEQPKEVAALINTFLKRLR